MGILRDAGLPPAFRTEEELLAEMYRQMTRVARHKLNNKDDAGDVVQDAWVRILEHRAALREDGKLIPWAKAIAANLASNANRTRKTKPIDEAAELRHAAWGMFSQPEMLTELSDLLGRLDATTRTLLLYKFYYGFRDDEIAAAMDVPVGTVKARIHRSRAKLKRQAENESTSET